MAAFGQDYVDKLSFLAEWFDYESAYEKKFLLNYYPVDRTIELYDRELNRIFLQRSAYDGLEARAMFIGNTVRIYGRQIKITDFADERTRTLIGRSRQHTFALIKPNVIDRIGEIFNQVYERGFEPVNIRMCRMTQPETLDLYEPLKGHAFIQFILEHITSGPSIAVELVGNDAIERWKSEVGPMDPIEARKTHPNSLRALYGNEKASNAFHAAANCEHAVREAAIFFPVDEDAKKPPDSTVRFVNSTCCVIKPHAVKEGKLGDIIAMITGDKFDVTALQMLCLSSGNAEEFLEVYKGVAPDFHSLLLSYLDGPCVALEVCGKENEGVEDVHGEFRKFVGPVDSEVARQIRPNTVRGRFGVDKYNNAVHCTDLKEDTVLELEYFFKILS